MHHMVCRVACGPGRAGKTAPEQTMSKHFVANEPWLHDKTYGLVVCNISGQFATSLSLIIVITCVYLYIILFMRQKCMVTRRESRALPEQKQVRPSFFFAERPDAASAAVGREKVRRTVTLRSPAMEKPDSFFWLVLHPAECTPDGL